MTAYGMAREALRRARYQFGLAQQARETGDHRSASYVLAFGALVWLQIAEEERRFARSARLGTR